MQELNKFNEFEDQFNSAAQAQASKFGMPAVTLDELPPTMDPVGEHTISQNEVKWIVPEGEGEGCADEEVRPTLRRSIQHRRV